MHVAVFERKVNTFMTSEDEVATSISEQEHAQKKEVNKVDTMIAWKSLKTAQRMPDVK